jgi:hypothetical protein
VKLEGRNFIKRRKIVESDCAKRQPTAVVGVEVQLYFTGSSGSGGIAVLYRH